MFYSRTVRVGITIFVNIILMIYEYSKLESQNFHNSGNSTVEDSSKRLYSKVREFPASTSTPSLYMFFTV